MAKKNIKSYAEAAAGEHSIVASVTTPTAAPTHPPSRSQRCSSMSNCSSLLDWTPPPLSSVCSTAWKSFAWFDVCSLAQPTVDYLDVLFFCSGFRFYCLYCCVVPPRDRISTGVHLIGQICSKRMACLTASIRLAKSSWIFQVLVTTSIWLASVMERDAVFHHVHWSIGHFFRVAAQS